MIRTQFDAPIHALHADSAWEYLNSNYLLVVTTSMNGNVHLQQSTMLYMLISTFAHNITRFTTFFSCSIVSETWLILPPSKFISHFNFFEGQIISCSTKFI